MGKPWNTGLTVKTSKKFAEACRKAGNTKRGKPSGMLGKHLSIETRKRISLTLKKQRNTKKWKRYMSKLHLGRKRPPYVGIKIEMKLKGRKFSAETRKRMSIAKKGRKLSDEHKRRIGDANKGKHLSEETKSRISKTSKGRLLSEEHRKNLSLSCRGRFCGRNHPLFGKHHSVETRKRIGLGNKGKRRTEEMRRRIRIKALQNWKNEEFVRKMAAAFKKVPNRLEMYLDKFLNTILPNEYKYVGDFQFMLGGKCPDFMNVNGQKKLIELYGDYWHKGENSQNRINHFRKYGFETLIIWEKELKDVEQLKNKVLEFHYV